jgi:hypothetical protein
MRRCFVRLMLRIRLPVYAANRQLPVLHARQFGTERSNPNTNHEGPYAMRQTGHSTIGTPGLNVIPLRVTEAKLPLRLRVTEAE